MELYLWYWCKSHKFESIYRNSSCAFLPFASFPVEMIFPGPIDSTKLVVKSFLEIDVGRNFLGNLKKESSKTWMPSGDGQRALNTLKLTFNLLKPGRSLFSFACWCFCCQPQLKFGFSPKPKHGSGTRNTFIRLLTKSSRRGQRVSKTLDIKVPLKTHLFPVLNIDSSMMKLVTHVPQFMHSNAAWLSRSTPSPGCLMPQQHYIIWVLQLKLSGLIIPVSSL